MTSMEVPQTILAQLGGRRFIAMTGANTFTGDKDKLTFKVGRNAGKVTHFRITLTPMDEYTVEALKVRGMECKTLRTVEHVGVENLREVFTGITGLQTSL